MTVSTAFLACRCGRCRIDLLDPTPRCRCQCFCWDCRQRALIAAARNPEQALPQAVQAYRRGVDLYYFTNVLRVDAASRALLEFSRLREDAANTTAMSRCCATLMCGTHPVYGGTTISVNADSCRITIPEGMPNQVYIFGADVPPEKFAQLELEPGVPMIRSFFDEIDTPPAVSFLAAVTAPVPAGFTGDDLTTFEHLRGHDPLPVDNRFFNESRSGA